MEGFFVIVYDWQREIIITFGSDKWRNSVHKSENSFLWSNKKMVVYLVSDKGDNNDNSFIQLSRLQNSLLMIIVPTTESYF